jgi:Rod binding domain-containing protein
MTSMLGGAEGDASSSIYGDMLSDTISQQLTSGPGLGFSRFLEKQLTPRGEHAAVSSQPLSANSTSLPTPFIRAAADHHP